MCEREDIQYADDILQMEYPGIGANLLTMALEGFLFFGLTILLERKFFIHEIEGLLKTREVEEVESIFSPNEVSVVYSVIQLLNMFPFLKDSDVAHEKRRLNSDEANDDLIQLKNLKKVSCCHLYKRV